MPSKKKLFVPVAITLLIILNGCGLWTDFTTYFNTYYNAKTLFDRLEGEILSQNKDPFEFRESTTQTSQTPAQQFQPQQQMQNQMQIQNQQQFQNQPQFQQQQQFQNQPQFQQQRTVGPTMSMVQIRQELKRVIEKCSKILQFHSESSFVDDALFMTGKSFYYQLEYASAQRKFLELAALSESKYHFENKLWLAKTYLQLRSFDEGLALIDEVKNDAISNKDEKLLTDASITLIGFYLFRNENRKAIEEINWLLGKIDDEEVSALVSYQLGKIYLKTGDEEEALNAFASVLKYSPTFDIEFESRIEHARLLKQLGRIEESEAELTDLRDRGKFNQQRDRILVELGDVYYDKKEYTKSVNTFKEVDSTYKFNPSSGIASFKLGEIYERHYRDYDSSMKYYSKATSSFVDRDMRTKANDRSRNLERYFSLKKTIGDLNRMVLYIKQPEKFVQDSIEYDIAFNEYQQDIKRKAELLTQTSLQNQQVSFESRQTNLPNRQQELQNQSKRKEEVTLATLISLGKVQKPSRPQISIDSLGTLLSDNYYNLGSHFFSELDVPDSAYYYFKLILDNYPDKPKKVQTLFALGTYYETIKEKQKADSLYQIIYDQFPKSTLFTEAGKKLGLIKEEVKKVMVTDDPAEPLYISAEEKYYKKEFREAIKAFREIYLNHSESPYSPKSIYYIGLIHEELKEYDSSAFYYGILSSKEYSSTPFGKAVMAKYTEYKNEKEKLERELKLKTEEENQKKLNEIKPVNQDSSAIKQKDVIQPREKDEIPIKKIRSDSLKTGSEFKTPPDSILHKPDTLMRRNERKLEVDSNKVRADSLKKKILD